MLFSVPTIIDGEFEWDSEKAESNIRRHGVSFDEAFTVFDDPNHVIVDNHSPDGRLLAVGLSKEPRLLTVVHVERGARNRIISAWRATRSEAAFYAKKRREEP
jgi:uncharacterized DUF497 family protein